MDGVDLVCDVTVVDDAVGQAGFCTALLDLSNEGLKKKQGVLKAEFLQNAYEYVQYLVRIIFLSYKY